MIGTIVDSLVLAKKPFLRFIAARTHRRVSEGASLVKSNNISAGATGHGFIKVQGHLLFAQPPFSHSGNEDHYEGHSWGRSIHQHVQDDFDMETGSLAEGGRLDEAGNVNEELQAEGKGIQPEEVLGKANTIPVSTLCNFCKLRGSLSLNLALGKLDDESDCLNLTAGSSAEAEATASLKADGRGRGGKGWGGKDAERRTDEVEDFNTSGRGKSGQQWRHKAQGGAKAMLTAKVGEGGTHRNRKERERLQCLSA